MSTKEPEPRLHVAIVGGGITGVCLALGLMARKISFTIYERAPGFGEIGAGIGFSPNAEEAMKILNPDIHAAYKRVANPNGEDYFQWIDGHSSGDIIYKLYLGEQRFQGCRRADFLEEIVKLIPADRVMFGKALKDIRDGEDGKVVMEFEDGTSAKADVVAGCDGIWSRVRHNVVGMNHPAAHPTFTNRVCFRALVPMEPAREVLTEHRASTRFMYNGPGAHIITYPVAMGTLLNILVVITDEKPWNQPNGKHTSQGTKADVEAAFIGWHPTSRAIVGLLPDQLETWAIFDMFENPAPSFVRGSVCMAGDAAHAAGPHLGAGAGMGIEDSLMLSSVLAGVQKEISEGAGDVGQVKGFLEGALKRYDDVRRSRTQAVLGYTRDAVDLFQCKYPGCGSDPEKFAKEITWRFHEIWNYTELQNW